MDALLILAAKDFGEKFKNLYDYCFKLLEKRREGDTNAVTDPVFGIHSLLINNYRFKFLNALQKTLSKTKECNLQNLFEDLRKILPKELYFEHLFEDSIKTLINEAALLSINNSEGTTLISMLEAISHSTNWIEYDKNSHGLTFSTEILKKQILSDIEDVEPYIGSMKLAQKHIDELNVNSQTNKDISDNIEPRRLFTQEVIKKVFDKCNGIHWESVNEKDFTNQIGTGNMSLKLIKHYTNTQVLFNNLKKLLNKNDEWVNNVEKSLSYTSLNKKGFRLDGECSNPAKEFNAFLDELEKIKET